LLIGLAQIRTNAFTHTVGWIDTYFGYFCPLTGLARSIRSPGRRIKYEHIETAGLRIYFNWRTAPAALVKLRRWNGCTTRNRCNRGSQPS